MSEKTKEDIVIKYFLISLAVVVSICMAWLIVNTLINPQVESPDPELQYEEYDSTIWTQQKVKYKTIEQYATHTKYILTFYDGTDANVSIADFKDIEEGDSTCIGDTRKFKRLIQ